MMKKPCLFLFACTCSILLYSQSSNQPNYKTDIPKVIPPSPNASAFEKFGVIPVDYSTGIPSISYPLWSWSKGNLNVNLALSYHAGGINVQDIASDVGMGWSLTGVGRVSRTIRGLPDDQLVSGFLYAPPFSLIGTTQYTGDYYYHGLITTSNYSSLHAHTETNSIFFDTVRYLAENTLDGEQDIFSYSLSGYSGRFVFNKNKEVVPLESTNIRFEAQYSSYSNGIPNGSIIGFKITDDNGVIYYFEFAEEETSETITTSTSISSGGVTSSTTSWLLTKIEDPISGQFISFSYLNHSDGVNDVKYETGFSESYVYDLEQVDINTGTRGFGLFTRSAIYSYIEKRSSDPHLNLVSFPDGSSVQFTYSFNRDDLKWSKALSSIEVRNMMNERIKKYDLSHSYFLSDGTLSTYIPSFSRLSNDYNRRLRLDKIEEVSNDNILKKPTVFHYNSINLNARDSKNIDYWGYNVNPARGNLTYTPSIPFDITERNILGDLNGLYTPGVDRRPDGEFVKAGLLEKIEYPTGGFTSFVYEVNRAYSDINYYEDKLLSNTVEWNSPFGQSFPLNLPSRTGVSIELLIKVEEFDPRPIPNPNEPQTCFAESQDNQIVRVEITSTDNSVSTFYEAPYHTFLGNGYKRLFDLPLNKTYNIKLIYDINLNCAYTFPFKAIAQATYYVTPYDKLAGGVRVRSIISDDGSGNQIKKEYKYSLSNGNSSAKLSTIPSYGYSRKTINVWPGPNPGILPVHCYQRQISFGSSPVNTFNFFNGSPLIYTRVIEEELDHSYTERVYDTLDFYPGGNIYPYFPGQDFPNLSGLLKKVVIRNSLGVILSEEEMVYNKFVSSYVSNPLMINAKGGGSIASSYYYGGEYYVADLYSIRTTRAEEISRVRKDYSNGQLLTNSVTKTYDPNKYYLLSAQTQDSKGKSETSYFFYPHNSGGNAISTLISRNILKTVIATNVIKGNDLNNSIYFKITNYDLQLSPSRPFPKEEQVSLLGGPLNTELTYDKYDNYGNLVQYTGRDGVVNSFLWGYKGQYPVAKIVGRPYQEVISVPGLNMSIIDNPGSENALLTEVNKVRSLSNCWVSTYAYKPLVGITREVDVNGKSTYYEYDNFNRLHIVRNNEFNVLKVYCYKYTNQPVLCNSLSYENDPMSQEFTKNNCSNGTGSTVLYIVPAGKYSSGTSKEAANLLAQNDLAVNGQSYANSVGDCAGPTCNTGNCTGNDKKCINGVCETGAKVCTSSVRINQSTWLVTYHYLWSDNSVSQNYQEYGPPCLTL